MRLLGPLDWTVVLAAVKDLSLLAFGAIGSWVALQGLHTWKRQLRGQADYDLARRMALALFKWRETVRRLRNPFIWASEEVSTSPDDAGKLPERIAYEKRWAAYADAATQLDALALEAEALWGAEARKPLDRIWDVQLRLRDALFSYLTRKEVFTKSGSFVPESERQRWSSEMEKLERIIHARPEADDDFWRDVVAAVKGVEDVLAPHLGRRRA